MKYHIVVHQKQWNAFSKGIGAKIGIEVRDVGEIAEGAKTWNLWSEGRIQIRLKEEALPSTN